MLSLREKLEAQLASEIISALRTDILNFGSASLLVSGGSTPGGLFQVLSNSELDWSKLNVSLVDERIVADDHQDQNGFMVKSILLKNKARSANFIPLVYNCKDFLNNLEQAKEAIQILKRPFSVVVLGLGGDGHTASLFPDAPELELGMDLANDQELILTTPQNAPYKRITFTRKALLNSNNLFLHCYGKLKKDLLESAIEREDYREFPISGFLSQKEVHLKTFWAI